MQEKLERRLSATVVVLSAGASPYLVQVLAAVTRCDPAPDAVLLVWSGARHIPTGLPGSIRIVRVGTHEFDHGGTRQLAVELCTTDVVAFLSDDAEPIDSTWLEALTERFDDPRVAAAFGRHVARPDATVAERAFRSVRYPPESRRVAKSSMTHGSSAALPISDANSAYRASALRAVGGFPRPCSYGEDQAVAVNLLAAGWEIVYSAEAAVWHSHALGIREILSRGWRAGVLYRSTRAVAHDAPSGRLLGDGVGLVGRMLRLGWSQEGVFGALSVLFVSVVRSIGFFVGTLSRR